MRLLSAFLVLPALLLAGCSSPAPGAAEAEAGSPADAFPPAPVDLHEVVDLSTGGSGSWSFDVEDGAKEVQIAFFATGKAIVGAGLPMCLSWETPAGNDQAGVCQGNGAGNILVAPYIVPGQVTYYENGNGAAPGHYSFTMEAQPSAVDFHAVAKVTY